MNRKQRIERLEAAASNRGKAAGQGTWDEWYGDFSVACETIDAWLSAHGYANAHAALAAGEAGPALPGDWSLARMALVERVEIEEKLLAARYPDCALWALYRRGKGVEWCAPVSGKLVYLGPDAQSAVGRFRELQRGAA
jgi:hypothetical protein